MTHATLCYLSEAEAGIEPADRGFADLGLTTWLPRRIVLKLLTLSPPRSAMASKLFKSTCRTLSRFPPSLKLNSSPTPGRSG